MTIQCFKQIIGENARCLVIAFTSYGGHSEPAQRFEWENVLAGVNCTKVFLIDSYQHWFHGGILGYSSSLEETIYKLEVFRRVNAISKLITIGSSMGGHGALLYGALLRANLTISLAPQTNMKRDWMAAIGDNRWNWKVHELHYIAYNWLDVAELYELGVTPDRTRIIYDASDPLDVAHAQRVEGNKGVVLEHVAGGHHVAYEMARSGYLSALVESEITGNPIARSGSVKGTEL